MSELIGVWINCASEEEATRIAEEAVKRRLAACSRCCQTDANQSPEGQ